ncbi:MAG TPA: efflux RND transporter periplasmic adaptor subunit [Pirellulales bacterium]|nr:efflux RND transporter periplasmic adaptor subunit [Pirellulales bacterium]
MAAPAPETETVRISGRLAIDPARVVELRSPVEGRLVATGGKAVGNAPLARTLRSGDMVEKGQLLAVIWSPTMGDLKTQFVAAASRVLFDESSLTRLRQESASRETVAAAERHCRTDRQRLNEVRQALEKLDVTSEMLLAIQDTAGEVHAGRPNYADAEDWANLELHAPHEGMLIGIAGGPGAVIDRGMLLAQVADTSELVLQVAPAPDYGHLPPQFDPDAGHWQVRSSGGKESIVCSLHDVALDHAGFSGLLKNAQGHWRPGQLVEATCEIGSKPVLREPTQQDELLAAEENLDP